MHSKGGRLIMRGPSALAETARRERRGSRDPRRGGDYRKAGSADAQPSEATPGFRVRRQNAVGSAWRTAGAQAPRRGPRTRGTHGAANEPTAGPAPFRDLPESGPPPPSSFPRSGPPPTGTPPLLNPGPAPFGPEPGSIGDARLSTFRRLN